MMVGVMKGKLLSARKATFKTQEGENKDYWRMNLEDPNSDYPFSLTIDYDLGQSLFSNEGTAKQYIGQELVIDINISSYMGKIKLKATDIQIAKS